VSVDDDELAADEEMKGWMKRQQSKRASNPLKREEMDELLRVPETFDAKPPLSPSGKHCPTLRHKANSSFLLHTVDVLKSSEIAHLSEYERKEILDHTQVFHYGARSNKKQATVENVVNNHGYDDERGDYIVVAGDHLAYRYEVVDTLGKGSFGQVLRCRDYQTGQSVAIKIIRNKKRFHHQALVEIKILDNLRKWVSYQAIYSPKTR
jgi:dual specificity tyrosine-phosphorylation-regulated kinase 2/3/4